MVEFWLRFRLKVVVHEGVLTIKKISLWVMLGFNCTVLVFAMTLRTWVIDFFFSLKNLKLECRLNLRLKAYSS